MNQTWIYMCSPSWIPLPHPFPFHPSGSSQCTSPELRALNRTPTSDSYWDYWETIALTRWTFVGKAMPLLFKTLSRFIVAFLPRRKCLLISWLQSLCAVILEPKKIKSFTISIVSLSICHEVMGQMSWSWLFECRVWSQLFHSPISPSSSGSLVPLCFLP